jgi:lysophospholipase L1-like esterase
VQDESTVRGLREIEHWLAEVDKRRHCSLPETSAYFIEHFTHNSIHPSRSGMTRMALKLPSSLHSPDSVTFVSPGWEDLSRSLPTLVEGDEQSFLEVMLEELNVKFALQLDLCPITDWSGQYAADPHAESGTCILLAGSSHSSRLIDPLESTHLTVVDSTVSGFRITESSVSAMAADIEEKLRELDPANTVVLVQLLDNSIYQCKLANGDRTLPKRGRDGNYHAEGELSVVNRDTLRELFSSLQPVFKAAKNFPCILLSPLPRYLWNRCCADRTHITNSEEPGYAASMGTALRELNKNLRNMIFMRKMKGVTVLNSLEALGLIPSADADTLSDDEGRIVALWGDDPVHPTRAAYRELAAKIAEKVTQILDEKNEPATGSGPKKRKEERRDPWISGSSSVAKRLDSRPDSLKNADNKGAKAPHRPYRGRGWWARGSGRGYGRGKKTR